MLPSAERLKRSHLFTKAYSLRKSVDTQFFTLYILPRLKRPGLKAEKSEQENRHLLPLTGFVVSKKVSKSACRRNKIKRRMREAYRQIERRSLDQWYVMVLVIKESVLKASWEEICRTMVAAFAEAKRKYGARSSQ